MQQSRLRGPGQLAARVPNSGPTKVWASLISWSRSAPSSARVARSSTTLSSRSRMRFQIREHGAALPPARFELCAAAAQGVALGFEARQCRFQCEGLVRELATFRLPALDLLAARFGKMAIEVEEAADAIGDSASRSICSGCRRASIQLARIWARKASSCSASAASKVRIRVRSAPTSALASSTARWAVRRAFAISATAWSDALERRGEGLRSAELLASQASMPSSSASSASRRARVSATSAARRRWRRELRAAGR